MRETHNPDSPAEVPPDLETRAGDDDAVPPPVMAEGVEARGERRLARLLAPLGRDVRQMRYLGKWLVLGALIGVVAGVGAIVFYEAMLKIVTTSLSIGSGGTFGPGLVIGAGVGAAFWGVLHHLLPGMGATPAPFVVVAMMSLFGGVAHAPIAMMLMVGEMTGSYGLLAPAMITISMASMVGDRTIYTTIQASRPRAPIRRRTA